MFITFFPCFHSVPLCWKCSQAQARQGHPWFPSTLAFIYRCSDKKNKFLNLRSKVCFEHGAAGSLGDPSHSVLFTAWPAKCRHVSDLSESCAVARVPQRRKSFHVFAVLHLTNVILELCNCWHHVFSWKYNSSSVADNSLLFYSTSQSHITGLFVHIHLNEIYSFDHDIYLWANNNLFITLWASSFFCFYNRVQIVRGSHLIKLWIGSRSTKS